MPIARRDIILTISTLFKSIYRGGQLKQKVPSFCIIYVILYGLHKVQDGGWIIFEKIFQWNILKVRPID
jgi:hypothetical protein